MKKLIISALILFTVVTSFYGCRKNDNPKLPDGIETGILPNLTQDPAGDEIIQDVNAFKTAFTLDLYWPNPVPQKMDVRVVKDGNYDSVKTLQANVTSFPTTINVTGPQLAQLFGIAPDDIIPGTTFVISPDITLQNGRVISAFVRIPNGSGFTNLAPYGSDALNTPGVVTSLTYSKVCTLFMDSLVNKGGGGAMVVDDPDVLGTTFPVIATNGTGADTTTVTLTNYATVSGAKLVLKIVPKSQTIVISKQFIAASFPGYPYHNWNAVGTGVVNACDNSMTLKITFSVDEGSFDPVTQTVSRP